MKNNIYEIKRGSICPLHRNISGTSEPYYTLWKMVYEEDEWGNREFLYSVPVLLNVTEDRAKKIYQRGSYYGKNIECNDQVVTG